MPEPPIKAVLVVEANPDISRLLAAAFSKWGVASHFESTGPDAVEWCCNHGSTIGMAFLGVSLPGMDGPTTLSALRALRPDLRCWFLGGFHDQYTLQDLLALGAEGVLSKPFDLQKLRSLLTPNAEEPPKHD
jgi:two-component system, OmpR family, response regulator